MPFDKHNGVSYLPAQKIDLICLGNFLIMSNKKRNKTLTDCEKAIRKQIQQYVSENYKNSNLRICDIAEHMAMCERQLLRYSKLLLEQTPTEYLRRYRLFRATKLLSQGYTVSVVTAKVGFSSYSYFARCFKDEYGCTATAYRSKG